MDRIDYTEDTVESRILAYFDFTFVTAINFLRPYANAHGFDLQQEAMDIAQDVAAKTLASDAYGDSLGPNWFKTTAENLCKNFLRNRTYDHDQHERWGNSVSWESHPEQDGWIDLTAIIRNLGASQRMAIYEAYCGYKAGELSGSARGSWGGMDRARVNLRKQGYQAA